MSNPIQSSPDRETSASEGYTFSPNAVYDYALEVFGSITAPAVSAAQDVIHWMSPREFFLRRMNQWVESQTHLDPARKEFLLCQLTRCYDRDSFTLDLSNCQLTSLPDLSCFPSLQRLAISHNQLESVSDLSRLRYLHTLYMSNNRFESIPDLSHMNELRFLDLSHNQLTEASDVSTLASLERLGLEGNNLSPDVIRSCIINFSSPNSLRVDLTDYYPAHEDYSIDDEGKFISGNGVEFYFEPPSKTK